MTGDNEALARLAFGRILRLGSRPTQPDDDRQYWACRAIILDALEGATVDHAPNYARDRFRGAQGDH